MNMFLSNGSTWSYNTDKELDTQKFVHSSKFDITCMYYSLPRLTL